MMTDDQVKNQKSLEQTKREERLAKNLRDNLRRRKAAMRKTKAKPTEDTPK